MAKTILNRIKSLIVVIVTGYRKNWEARIMATKL